MFTSHDNPILARLREIKAKYRIGAAVELLTMLEAYELFGGYTYWTRDHPVLIASDPQRDHARRVLSKLAALHGDT